MIETCGKLRDDERAFATALYDNREKILLASLHERDSPRERFIAREATRLSGDNFVRQMGAIKGAATESYVAILLKQHLETADIISSFEYIQHEPGNAFSKQTHKFEIDLIVACPEEDFYSALSSLNKQEHIHVGISPGLHGKILKYD